MFEDLKLGYFMGTKRLEWICHLNRMDADRIPKSIKPIRRRGCEYTWLEVHRGSE